MSLSSAMLIASAVAAVICTVWTVRLRAAGDPVWKVAAAAALLSLTTALLELKGPLLLWAGLAIAATGIAAGLLWSSRRTRTPGR